MVKTQGHVIQTKHRGLQCSLGRNKVRVRMQHNQVH